MTPDPRPPEMPEMASLDTLFPHLLADFGEEDAAPDLIPHPLTGDPS
jgi:hypothetical protein